MTKSSDTTHTQSQWTTKGVMSWQPEQSGHAQLPTNQNTKSSQSHSSKPHTKSGGHVKQIVSWAMDMVASGCPQPAPTVSRIYFYFMCNHKHFYIVLKRTSIPYHCSYIPMYIFHILSTCSRPLHTSPLRKVRPCTTAPTLRMKTPLLSEQPWCRRNS